ncbi:hypothetical protein H1D31_16110 [Alishewanella sp. BS5-314]|uniref:hypothetical protein n=1 Tax=Alishewanella sp. BS5-314 TaxID=2755587 RepID=UPI0021BB4DEE|nr:hypothetical protein [Alishewanella sp. BS5-314]MCT8127535.1 hypothetical protein [Alishewanella sp. BS5-314]
MSVLLSTKCAEKALRSTSAVYHIVKATSLHGEEKVINEMARRERDSTGVSYGEAVTQAAARHREIMALSEKGEEYKSLSEGLSRESSLPLTCISA